MPWKAPTHKPAFQALKRPDPVAEQAREKRANAQRDRESTRIYKRKRWQAIRKAVLSRNPLCQTPRCNRLATDVDHINGDNTDMRSENLQALCRSCHSRKTARENGGFGNRLKNKD